MYLSIRQVWNFINQSSIYLPVSTVTQCKQQKKYGRLPNRQKSQTKLATFCS